MSDDGRWRRYWRHLVSRSGADVEDEIAFHVEMRAGELVRDGMEPAAARTEALKRFGDRGRVMAAFDRMERRRGFRLRLWFLTDELRQDVGYAIRALVKRPGFTLAAASSLALGIGATTTVLSVVDPLLFRPLPVPAADELVVIGATHRAMAVPAYMLSLPTVRDVAAERTLFSDVAAATLWIGVARLANSEQAERRLGFLTSGRFFPLFRVRPALGRFYDEAEDLRREPVAVLSHRAWQTEYRSDPTVLGRSLFLNGVPLTIIGVAPRGFQGIEHIVTPDFFAPAGVADRLTPGLARLRECRSCTEFGVVARRRPERSLGEVQAGLDLLVRRLAAQFPEMHEGYRLTVYPEPSARLTVSTAQQAGPVGVVFLALAGLVLLAACVNATNLVLTRSSERAEEMTLRRALGASRGRVIRQLLTENVVLALLGLGTGCGLAWMVSRWIARAPATGDLPISWSSDIDLRVVSIATGVTILVGLLAGLGPAILGSRTGRERPRGGRGIVNRTGGRLRAALVVGQVAASLIVLIFAALFGASVRRAAEIDVGFESARVLKVGFDGSAARYDDSSTRRAFARIAHEVKRLPEVEAAAWTTGLPMTNSPGVLVNLHPDDGRAVETKSGAIGGWMAAVEPDYFATMGIRLVEGRAFRIEDDGRSAQVAVVNQRVAELLWPGKSPVGRRFRLGPDQPPIEVVGVARTGRYVLMVESPRPFVYLPFAQNFGSYAFLTVKTVSDAKASLPRVRAAIATGDPNLTPFDLAPMQLVVSGIRGLLPLRLGAMISSGIGFMALVLTVIGLYGVIAYSVAQRTREIGVRIALGAAPGLVVRSVLGHAARLAGTGIAIGLILAVLVSRAAAGLLLVEATDPRIYGLVVAGLVLATFGSAFLPARRAARLDPVRALRADG